MQKYPLSHPQRRIWFAEEEHPGTAINTIALFVSCPPATTFDSLQEAINGCLRDNEGLRTHIVKGAAGDELFPACQHFVEYSPCRLERKTFSGLKEAHDWMRVEARQPIKLYQSPLLRFTAIVIDEFLGYFLQIHHIITDGRSTRIMMEDIEQRLKTPGLEKRDSYRDFIAFENGYKQSDQFLQDRDFWMQELSSFPEPLQLANGKGEPGQEVLQIAKILSSELRGKIHAYAGEYGVSVYKQVMTAFAVYVAKSARTENFALGIANHNRSEKRFFDICGMFVSSLPLVFNFDAEKNFTEYAIETGRKINTILKEHSRYPLDLLVSDMRKEYDIDIGHIMNVSFVGHPDRTSGPIFEVILPGQSRNSINIHVNSAGTDAEGELEILFMADATIYSTVDLETMFDSLTTILEHALDAPGIPVGKLPLVSDKERARVLGFNPDFRPYRENLSIPALFREKARAYPDHPALVSKEGTLTYAELDAWTDNIARGLVEANQGQPLNGRFAGVSMTRSISMVAALLGILKSGGAYVPLDPEYPQERVAFMAEDAGISLVLVNDDHGLRFSSLTPFDVSEFPKERTHDVLDVANPEDLAYAIYTSGTTGKPKGVPIRHHQVINLVDGLAEAFDIHQDSRLLQFASLNFDASVAEIFPALLTGATLVVALDEHRSDSVKLGNMIEELEVSVACIPPAMLAVMPYRELPALSTLIVAGESTDPAVIKLWSKGRNMVNGYGPTENTVATSAGRLKETSLANDIGIPLKNVSCFVLDPYMQLLPVGIPGELFIGGVQVSTGYINRPELNENAFRSNPYETKQARNPRIYKSGDLVRWLDSGHIEFIGRVDFQVKIRGHRIECGEVGTAISGLEGITSCLVIPLASGATHRLVAYVIPDSKHKDRITPDHLRSEAANILPGYMVPSAFVIMDEFPMTPGSKIDRRKLPVPSHDDATSVEYVAPRNELETKLAQIWLEILKLEQVSVLDDFFDAGGDSLLCMTMIAEAEKRGLNIHIAMVRELRTIEKLAQAIREAGDAGPQLPALQKRPHSEPGLMPLNALMMRRQEQTMIAAGVPCPPSVTVWRMTGPMDEKAMLGAVKALVARHEALRIQVREHENKDVFQPVITAGPEEVLHVTEEELPALIVNWAEAEHMENDPSCGFRLFCLGQNEHVLVMAGTHELLDAWAMRMLTAELAEIYNARCEGREPDLEPEPYQVMDFADWYNGLVRDGRLEESRLYWKNRLAGAKPVFDAPPSPDAGCHEFATVSGMKPLPIALKNDFEALCKAKGSTLFEGLLALYIILLGRRGETDDVLTACVTALRERSELQDMLACLTNRLYIRANLSGSAHFDNSLEQVKTALQEASRNALWPTWQDVDPEGRGYPGVFFHYAPASRDKGPQFQGLDCRTERPMPERHWPLPFVLMVIDHERNPALQSIAKAGFCDESFVDGMLEEYLEIMTEITRSK